MTQSVQNQLRLDREIARMRDLGTPFAIATVVRTLAGTAAKPGAKALLTEDGTLVEGWLGGGCTTGAVSRAARRVLATGTAQLVSLKPQDLLDAEGVTPGEERDGVHFARNGCPSRGSMDIFVEPVLPLPELVICGTGPVAIALATLAGSFDFRRRLCGPDAVVLTDIAEVVQDSFALPKPTQSDRFVVVATQGRGDLAALRGALASDASQIAFVGSRRKFASLSSKLAAEGECAMALSRVLAPAGLDIKAITPEEIALSILAQIVALRRGAEIAQQAATTERRTG